MTYIYTEKLLMTKSLLLSTRCFNEFLGDQTLNYWDYKNICNIGLWLEFLCLHIKQECTMFFFFFNYKYLLLYIYIYIYIYFYTLTLNRIGYNFFECKISKVGVGLELKYPSKSSLLRMLRKCLGYNIATKTFVKSLNVQWHAINYIISSRILIK